MVKIGDRNFVPSIKEVDVRQRVGQLANAIVGDIEVNDEVIFLAMLNGAFVFAADLLRSMPQAVKVSFVKMASYEGTKSTGEVKELIGLNEDVKDKTIIIIEDIIESGLTVANLIASLQNKQARNIKIAALFVKPNCLQTPLKIDYTGFEIPNDFIIGYGMDCDGYGRNLPDIYTLT